MMLKSKIFSIQSEADFQQVSLDVFRFQYAHNEVYRRFCNYLKVREDEVNSLEEIPFLPIQFFKTHRVLSSREKIETTFLSSGTTGMSQSKHFVTDLSLYEKSFEQGFRQFYGKAKDLVVLALLPSYLERKGSSLIYMAQALIEKSQHKESGFYLDNLEVLAKKLKQLDAAGERVLLIGVSFALLALVEKFNFNLKNTIVMETGGMKGRRKEMIRAELHAVLSKGFGVSKVHSEYGMTELLSQAYSDGGGVFHCPKQMKIMIRDSEDALRIMPFHKNGGVNVIDLANLNSCAFIATQDLGRQISENSYEILGRFDNTDVRGCNLLVL